MSDETKPSAPASEAAPAAVAPAGDASAAPPAESTKENKPEGTAPAAPAATEGPAKEKPAKAEASTEKSSDKQAADVEMEDATKPASEPTATVEEATKAESAQVDKAAGASESTAGDASGAAAAADVATPDKSKARRKSNGGAASAKKLNKKASKARITHLDAKPGDHFFVKLKGFPQWPAIICDEDMLPQALLTTRPVTAKRSDGTYRDDYADGGKRAGDRTYPVMYLHTNEFGWVPNTDLIELNTETVLDVKMDKMRKDLQAAHRLASENHPLSYFKGVLQEFQEELLAKQKAKEAKAATPAKKKKKVEEDEDIEMAGVDEEGGESIEKKTKKRKAEENVETPQRADSVKKPKIKLTTNSVSKANGAAVPKPSKASSEPKTSKSKPKKSKEPEEKAVQEEETTPKEPELTPEEKHKRKEKEVLFLRHKLQKGLLTRDQEPKEEEMEMMSEYIAKLESFIDLEVSIIRATKINKVLKAILKLESIPKEAEFKFRPRSQVLLDQWNKLLADGGAEPANGVNGVATKDKEETKTNGVKEHTDASKSTATEDDAKQEAKSEEPAAEAKPAAEEKNVTQPVEASA